MTTTKLPEYDQLPIHSKYPPKTAWGLWGDDDDLGTLNLLTEERVMNVSRLHPSIVLIFLGIKIYSTWHAIPS